MYSKQNEIEVIVENLIEEYILEAFVNYFANKKECEYALQVLKDKLEEMDDGVFNNLFD